MKKILSLLQDFDVGKYLPKQDKVLADMVFWTRFFMLIGPIVLLVFGLIYFFFPPKEANHHFGFRTYWGMGSVQAWRYTQKMAGIGYMGVGGLLLLICAIVGAKFSPAEAEAMVHTAQTWVVVQIITVLVLWLTLNILPIIFFDRKGERRGRTRRTANFSTEGESPEAAGDAVSGEFTVE